MITDGNDFPELREAVRGSVLGGATLRTLAALRVAWSEAVVTRSLKSRRDAISALPAAEIVRLMGMALATASMAAWAMSLAIPTYLSTTIPTWAFFFGAFISALAAAWPDAVARQWSRSMLHRVTRWFRQPH